MTKKNINNSWLQKPINQLHWWKIIPLIVITLGGTVLATTFTLGNTRETACTILNSLGQDQGYVCKKLGEAGTSTDRIEIEIPANNAQIGVKDYTINESGQVLRFVNDNDKPLFIPVRSRDELSKALEAKRTGNTVLEEVDVCVVGRSSPLDIGSEEVPGCSMFCLEGTLSQLREFFSNKKT
jgi:hypothetical protein